MTSRNTIVDDMVEAVEAALVSTLALPSAEARETAVAAVLAICDAVGGSQEYIPRFPLLGGERLVPYRAPWRAPGYCANRVTRAILAMRAEQVSIREISRRLGLSRRQVCTHLAKASSGPVGPVQESLPIEPPDAQA